MEVVGQLPQRKPHALSADLDVPTCSRPDRCGDARRIHTSKNGMNLLIEEEEASMEEHVRRVKELKHPFDCPPDIPLDLQYATLRSVRTKEPACRRRDSMSRLRALSDRCRHLTSEARSRMSASVRQVAGGLHIGLILSLIHI